MPESRSVFITGAAAGIGRKTAIAFAKKGYTVGAFDIDEVGLKTLTEELERIRTTVITGHLDVTDSEEMDLAGHLKEIDINTKGVVNGLYAAFPHLRATPNSVVVNLASASAIYGQAELANYSATKFFVRGITEALDLEWGRYGIRVIAMWPLYVQTAMTENVTIGTTQSLGIRLTAQDIADAIVAAVEPSALRRAVHQVHFPVGVQSKVLASGARFSPAWLTRLVNKKLAHS